MAGVDSSKFGPEAALRRSFPSAFTSFADARLEFTLADVFEQQVVRTADACALACGDTALSYQELNARCNQLAHHLLASGCERSRPIALLLDQGPLAVVWTLAILKAGLIFAPLDDRLPDAVIVPLLRALDPQLVITATEQTARASGWLKQAECGKDCVVLPANQSIGQSGGHDSIHDSLRNPIRTIGCDDTAYVFFTSGSTGAPKGVFDCHRNVLHNVQRYTNSLGFAPGDRLSLIQNPSFSGTVSTLFGALLNGATLLPYNLREHGLEELSAWLSDQKITALHCVPAIFRGLNDPHGRFASLRLIRLEGDRCTADDLQHFRQAFDDRCVLVNGLGATEFGLVRQCFIDKTTSERYIDFVPVGYPVSGTKVTLLNASQQTRPAIEQGEIVVESAYLASGYWRDPELTRQKFERLASGVRRYRSGDLGRMQADGLLVHMGRTDGRVKIAGDFVDLTEIEQALLQVRGIRQAAVIDRPNNAGEPQLIAYLVASAEMQDGSRPGSRPELSALRAHLRTRLADHMQPKHYLWLDQLPLSKDMKVDCSQLPAPARVRTELPAEFVPPGSPLERDLALVWQQVLDLEPIGVNESFFELGGDSLSARRMLLRLDRNRFTGIGILDLFERPTIRALLKNLGGDKLTGTNPLVPASNASAAGANTTSAQSNAAGPSDWPSHSIAVIGMAARFPGADSVDEFWNNLRDGVESITFFDPAHPSAQIQGQAHSGSVAARGELCDIDQFDAALFRLSPKQARMLDPQQRLWLECVYLAAEDAGLELNPSADASEGQNVGVFVGGRDSNYLLQIFSARPQLIEHYLAGTRDDIRQLRNGNDADSLATRTSFLFGFQGPSMTVRSACSTSLVAIAQACQAIAAGQCTRAIAGGVSLALPSSTSYHFADGDIYSHDGHCRSFDADASGTVFGDGVGAVVLKRLDAALADGDRIDAVIRGWAVNNDGAGKASFAAPSATGQARTVLQALAHAKVTAGQVGYVEAHGTATPIGDPIEFEGLQQAFRASLRESTQTNTTAYCGLGSVKSNVGHLDIAAGVAGFIKATLAVKHGEIPATLHFKSPNPQIDLAGSPFFINNTRRTWPIRDSRRVAGVSSLGVGGTNCHVVIEQAPAIRRAPIAKRIEPALSDTATKGIDLSTDPRRQPQVLTLSANSPASLQQMACDFAGFLLHEADRTGTSDLDLAGLACSSQFSRSRLPWRMAALASSHGELAELLRNSVASARNGAQSDCNVWQSKASSEHAENIGFVFSGQGSQYFGMGRALFEQNARFRQTLVCCDEILRGQLPMSLLEVMYGAHSAPELIHETEYAQPALFALEYALADLLRQAGIVPRYLIGHSLGGLVAAGVAGVFSLEEGLRFAAARGRLMQSTSPDAAMLAIFDEADALERRLLSLAVPVEIAARNAPGQTVVSGTVAQIERLQRLLAEHGVYSSKLKATRGFHSAMMDPILEPLARLADSIGFKPPNLALFSEVTGARMSDEAGSPIYWRNHARAPVEFARGLNAMRAAGCKLWIEIGPDATLSAVAASVLEQSEGATRDDTRTPLHCAMKRSGDDLTSLQSLLAALYVQGVPVEWSVLRETRQLARVRLPAYRFDRKRYWHDELRFEQIEANALGHPLIGRPMSLPGSSELRFAASYSTHAPHFVLDHRLFGTPVIPGASHFAALVQAAKYVGGADSLKYTELYLLTPLVIAENTSHDVQFIFRGHEDGWAVEIVSAVAEQQLLAAGAAYERQWSKHVVARAQKSSRSFANDAENNSLEFSAKFLAQLRAQLPNATTGANFYTRIWANQGGTGSAFRWIERVQFGDRQALSLAVCPAHIVDPQSFGLHPGLIEAACQTLHCCGQIESFGSMTQSRTTYVPFSVDEIDILEAVSSGTSFWCYAQLRELNARSALGDLAIFSENGRPLVRITGFGLRVIGADAIQVPSAARDIAAKVDIPVREPTVRSLRDFFRDRCAAALGVKSSEIDLEQGFIDMGLDSIAAVQLTNLITRDYRIKVKVTELLASERLNSLIEILQSRQQSQDGKP